MSVNLKSAKSQEKPNQSEDNQYQIVKCHDWNPDLHSIGEIKQNKNSQGESASLKYSAIGSKRFLLALPAKMNAPFGASPPYKKQNTNGSQSTKQSEGESDGKTYSVNVSFSNTDSAEEAECLEKMRQFDENMTNVLGDMAIKKPELFDIQADKLKGTQESKDQQIRAVVMNKYTCLLKEAKDKTKNYPPTINCKFQNDYKNSDLFSTAFFDSKRNPVVLSQNPNDENYVCRVIPPYSRVTALVSGNFWKTTKGCGFSLKVIQLIIYPTKSIPMDQCLLDDPSASEDEEDTENNGTVEESSNDADQTQVQEDDPVENQDDTEQVQEEDAETEQVQEEEEVQEPEPVPEPVKPVAKVAPVALRPVVKAPVKAPAKK